MAWLPVFTAVGKEKSPIIDKTLLSSYFGLNHSWQVSSWCSSLANPKGLSTPSVSWHKNSEPTTRITLWSRGWNVTSHTGALE